MYTMTYIALAVLRELDGHKNVFEQVYQNGQTWTKSALARRAISFMLENLLNRPDLFRCQKSQETHFSNIEARLHVSPYKFFAAAEKTDEFVCPGCRRAHLGLLPIFSAEERGPGRPVKQ